MDDKNKKPGFLQLLEQGIGSLRFGAFRGNRGYDAASTGARYAPWQGSILGPNTIQLADWEPLLRRSRDAIRNSALAASAIGKFESNIIGTGIVPHFTHPNPDIRKAIQKAFDRWVKQADFRGQVSFYGLQAALARSLFETGECFCRYHVVDDGPYFQLQLIETEQVPIYLNMVSTGAVEQWPNSVVREGIIFNQNTDRRLGYRIYGGNPYDTIVNAPGSYRYFNVDVDEMIHVMKPLRPNMLRGVPMMAAVLPLLYDIEGYADSERLRKRIASMFAFFLTKNSLTESAFPANSFQQPSNNSGAIDSRVEPGTIFALEPGETMEAPELPNTGDYQSFMYVELHKFAAGVGLTYEQLTGDMKGVNYSSARVALLEFRRAAEQFQNHIIIDQFCNPVLSRWMKEAVMSGALELPSDYVEDPEDYEACSWVSDGFEWVDPVKEVQAYQMAVRSGFTSRSMVIRKSGFDPEQVDAQIADERMREAKLGIITDTNSNLVLIGRETQPLTPTQADPDATSEQEAQEAEDAQDDE